MAEFQFECPECGSWIVADEILGGMPVECPGCSASITVPRTGLVPGTSLGDFSLERRIGIGGMGEVWLAIQKSLERKIAVKILPHSFASDPESVEMFMKEIQIAGKLSHPNIVEAYYAGFEKGLYFLAAEYVEGIELSELLASHEPLSEQEALRIGLKMSMALRYAWDKFRILHRDIKPSNIILDFDGEPKLMDMGISSLQGDEEHRAKAGVVIGTPQYMSPEQGFGDPNIDFRADIYSLGATLFHISTGYVPFDGATHADIIASHAKLPLKPPDSRNPRLSKEFSSLVTIMMAKDKDERQRSWTDVIRDIELVQRGMPPATPLPSQPAVPAQEEAKGSAPAIMVFPSPDPLSQDYVPHAERRSFKALPALAAALLMAAICASPFLFEWLVKSESQEEGTLLSPADPRSIESDALEQRQWQEEPPPKEREESQEPKAKALAKVDESAEKADGKPLSLSDLATLCKWTDIALKASIAKMSYDSSASTREPGEASRRKEPAKSGSPSRGARPAKPDLLTIASMLLAGAGEEGQEQPGRLFAKNPLAESLLANLSPEETLALGRIIAKGDGVPKNSFVAAALYERVANSGDPEVVRSLATMYRRGDRVRKSVPKAVELFTKLAGSGDSKAMFSLGDIYSKDGSSPQGSHRDDEATAMDWYSKGVELKNPDCMVALGSIYADGDESVRSGKKAIELFKQGVELGSRSAMTKLGVMYSRGQGVPMDLHYAFYLYEKAANLGDPQAMFNVGVCYMTGQGVGQDVASAHEWLKKAAYAGSEDARDYIKKRRIR